MHIIRRVVLEGSLLLWKGIHLWRKSASKFITLKLMLGFLPYVSFYVYYVSFINSMTFYPNLRLHILLTTLKC